MARSGEQAPKGELGAALALAAVALIGVDIFMSEVDTEM